MESNPFLGNEPSHIAAHLVAGDGFASPYEGVPIAPTAQQPPLYPSYLAVIFGLFGSFSRSSLIVLLTLNAAIGSILSLLIYRVGQRWFGALTGMIAAWTWALFPWLAIWDLAPSNYLFSTALVLIWLMLLPKEQAGMTTKRAAIYGVFLGFGALINPMLTLLWPASWRWLASNKQAAIVSLAGMALTVSPWLVRNYRSMGHIYPALRDNFGMELYIGNHANMNELGLRCHSVLCRGTADYLNSNYPGYPANDTRLFAALGEQEFMKRQRIRAVSYIRSDPLAFLVRSLKRCGSFWLLPLPWLYLPILIFAIAALCRAGTELRGFCACLFLLYPLAFYVTQVAFVISYRHPIEPLMLLLAGHFCQSTLTKQSTACGGPPGRLVLLCELWGVRFLGHRGTGVAVAGTLMANPASRLDAQMPKTSQAIGDRA